MILSVSSAIFVCFCDRSLINKYFISQVFIGQVMGSSVGTQVFVKFGWRAAAVLNMALYGFQIFILLLRGPHCKQYTWFGYEGGLESRKSVVDERKRLEVAAAENNNTTESSPLPSEKV
jgi:hypothetical protein